MPTAKLSKKLEAIRLATARAEERGTADLAEVAEEVDVPVAHLCGWIDAVIALDERVGADRSVTGIDPAMTRDGTTLVITRNHLRDFETEPPDMDTAVRLLIAGNLVKAMAPDLHLIPLARATTKLERIVGQEYPIAVKEAPHFVLVHESIGPTSCRVLQIEYVNDQLAGSEREVEPVAVFSAGGYWYLEAYDRRTAEVRAFRIDRIREVRNASEVVAPRERTLTGQFDLGALEHRLTVRVRSSLIDAFRAFDVRVEAERSLGGSTVEADLVVYGERRLDQLLLSLGPDGEILAPTEYRTRRADGARALLDRYV
ncbi:MAG: helix-turn-helix transcriptional regulator [Actinomycetes bacterium]